MIRIKSGRNILIGIVLMTSIIFTTFVYAAFNAQLNIEGEAVVRSNHDIRITNISITEQTNGAYETFNNKYNKDVTFIYVTLPSNSSITYEVEITDKASVGYILESIEEISNTNSNIDIDISINQYDLINPNSTKTFYISFTNNTSEEQVNTLVLKYHFLENRFIITFDANGGTISQTSKEVSYHSTYGDLPVPERDGYTFLGWNGKNMFNEVWRNGDYDSVDRHTSIRASSDFQVFLHSGQEITITYNYSKPYYYTLAFFENSNDHYTYWTHQNLGFSWIKGEECHYTATQDIYISVVWSHKNWFDGNEASFDANELNDINFMIEEGNTATEYEPYYVTSDVNVTQMKDHILTAIWEEN